MTVRQPVHLVFFFLIVPATPEIYTLSLHDALPISSRSTGSMRRMRASESTSSPLRATAPPASPVRPPDGTTATPASLHSFSRSEEHTSELQSLAYLVCRLLLEKKKTRRRPLRPARS